MTVLRVKKRALLGAALGLLILGGTAWVVVGLGRDDAPVTGENAPALASGPAAGGAPAPSGASLRGSGVAAGAAARGAAIALLSGRVTRDAPGGAAVAAARVVALRLGDSWTRGPGKTDETTTDADGRFAFAALPPGEVMVVAFARGFSTRGLAGASADGFNPLAVTLGPGRPTTLDLVLVAGGAAAGRVVDAAGKPVARATVRARAATGDPAGPFSRPSAMPSWSTATTGGDGAFRFDDLAAGDTYEFDADAAGQHPAGAGPLRVPSAEALAIEIRMPAVRWVDVQVVDDESGAPVADATVRASESTDGRTWRGVPHVEPWKTGTDGRARAGPCLDVPLLLTAGADGYEEPITRYDGPALPTSESSLVLRIRRGVGPSSPDRFPVNLDEKGLRLRVLGPDGKPVPAASAWSYQGGGKGGIGPGGGGLVRDGIINLGYSSPPAEFVEVFDARDADGAPLPYGAGRAERGESRDVELRLGAERTLSGTVVDVAGRGLAGVLVLAQPSWWPDDPMSPLRSLAHARARTDAQGAFRLAGLADTTYRLVLRLPPDLVAEDSEPVAAGASGVTVKTRAAVSVTLTLVDSAGRPVSGALVSLLPAGTDPRNRDRLVSMGARLPPVIASDARGVAVLAAVDPRSAYLLMIDPPAARDDVKPFARDAWSPHDETIALTGHRRLSGRVHDRGGAPLEGVTVSWMLPHAGGYSTRTAADGTFAFEGVAPGEVFVVPYFHGQRRTADSPAAVRVPPGANSVDVEFDPGLPLLVRVANAPAEPWRASLVAEGAGVSERLDLDTTGGRLLFRGLRADRAYTLCVSPIGTLSLLRPGLRASDGEVTVRLEPGLTITVRVVAPDGASDLQVGFNDGRISANGTKQPDGRFAIEGLPAGAYDISAWAKKGDQQWHGHLVIIAGQSGEIEVKPHR